MSNFGCLFNNPFLIWLRGRRRSRVGDFASHVDVTTRSQPDHAIASSCAGSQPTFNIRLVVTYRVQGGHWQARSRDKGAFGERSPERLE